MRGRPVIFPECPACGQRYYVGRVISCELKRDKVIKAYYCSNCLTEFDSEGNIFIPIDHGVVSEFNNKTL